MTKAEKLIIEHFPKHLTIRPEQLETLKRMLKAYLSGKKHFIGQLPTGVGKSLIAITFGKIIHTLKTKNTTILTKTKALQDQYTYEFGFLVDLKGKNNYDCPKNKVYGTYECKKHLKNGSCSINYCPYVKQRDKWVKNQFIKITNMSFFLTAPLKLVGEEVKSEVIIIDECHKFPMETVENFTIKINSEIERLFIEATTYGIDINNLKLELENFVNRSIERQSGNLLDIDVQDLVELDFAIEELQKYLEEIETKGLSEEIHYKLSQFLNSLKFYPGRYIIYDEDESIVFAPFRAENVANYTFSEKGNFFVHLSATIGDIETYARELGIKPDEYDSYEVESPFPIENRPIYYIPLVNFNYKNKEEAIKIVANFTDMIIDEYPGQRGIIHTSSYNHAWEIRNNLKPQNQKKVRIPKDSKEIMTYIDTNFHLISPALYEGYDFKDDLARWQIMTKVPYLNLGDKYTQIKSNYDKDWYFQETINKIIQAYGRAVRHHNDTALFFIVDSNFGKFLNSKYIPKYIKDAIIVKDS